MVKLIKTNVDTSFSPAQGNTIKLNKFSLLPYKLLSRIQIYSSIIMTEKFFLGKIVSVVKRDEYSEFLMKVSTVCTKVLLLIHVLKFIKLRNQKKINIII